MIDAVISYHDNPQTCGVTKFNYRVASLLGVPHDTRRRADQYRWPLLSLKTSEWHGWADWIANSLNSYDLFFHDAPDGIEHWPAAPHPWQSRSVIERAWRVYAANSRIAEAIRPFRSDVVSAFCPATVHGDPKRGAYQVLAFGMAGKLQIGRYRDLKRQLDDEHEDYTVSLSTAVHEGNPWDKALTESTQAMRQIFGQRLRVLGYLGDDALAKELQDCDAVAVYFDPAVRENNTSVWAALAAGKKVYTNTDEHSPELDPEKYSWSKLLETLS